MPDYDNNLTGVLFPNEKKRNDKDPNARGSCEIEGKEYWVSAWTKVAGEKSKFAGQKFMSLAFTLKDEQTATTTAPAPKEATGDDIPF